jgi:4-diphosphocytidyl-2C-methyl-D-erythritol kinase
MSGSGSTLFAEWETAAAATQARKKLPADLPALVTAVLPRHPLRDDLIGE